MTKSTKSSRVSRIRAFKQVSPEEWLDRVMRVKKSVRPRVACVIWWDWFGSRTCNVRWDHLDHLIKAYDLLNAELTDKDWNDMIEGLVEHCGYTTEEAQTRIKKINNH